jgi:very-short-patch-repair endonuclease
VRSGAIVRLRPGWFAAPTADPSITRAIRAGGASTCVSETSRRGLWTPPGHALHIALQPTDRHLRNPDTGQSIDGRRHADLVIHWDAGSPLRTSRGVVPWEQAVMTVLRCTSQLHAVAVIESGLHSGAITPSQLLLAAEAVSDSWRGTVAGMRSDAGSGSESLFRFGMLQHGVTMRSQVRIPGVGDVDFVIGDRLIVEIDSEKHHGSREDRLRDLARDAAAAALGFITLRFDYTQIMHDWDSVASAVLAALSRGDHLGHRQVIAG